MLLAREIRFDELRKVLEHLGYETRAPRGGSSHHTFRKTGAPMLTIPKDDPVKIAYVRMVKAIIEKEAER